MECSYDTLFECDCEGIDALQKVPCSGSWLIDYAVLLKWGGVQLSYGGGDQKFRKRVYWIVKCGSFAGGIIFFQDNWRSPTIKTFFRAEYIRTWPFPEYPWYYRDVELTSPSCFYLGRFPYYWDYQYGFPRWPHGKIMDHIPIRAAAMPPVLNFKPAPPVQPTQPFSMTPSVYTNEYLPMNIYTRQDISFFHGEAALQNIDRQTAFIEERKRMLQDCLKKNCLKKFPALSP